jgi:NAD(P)H-dependent FMN reductase
MSGQRIVVLDGTPAGARGFDPARAALLEELRGGDDDVTVFALRDVKAANCIGCFGCWVETPGICREGDAGRAIVEAAWRSDTVVLFTPVAFGGVSPELKVIVDRFLPLILPFFGSYHGETHHTPRYTRYPRWVGIGVQDRPDESEAAVFKALIGRGAINFHAPTHAAAVVARGDGADALRRAFQAVMARNDAPPAADAVAALLPAPDPGAGDTGAGRALLLVGSPKTRDPSTSAALGGYLLAQLEAHGWETESRTLRPGLRRNAGVTELLAACDRADLIVLAFPLYIDGLPILVAKALELIAAHRRAQGAARPQRLVVVCNNGFPEACQNNVAAAICHRFAFETGIGWAGSLALGAGEALLGGRPLDVPDPPGGLPVEHVRQALAMAGAALAIGRPVPAEATAMMAGCPLPQVPFAAWQAAFREQAGMGWMARAAGHGVSAEQLLAQPYAV